MLQGYSRQCRKIGFFSAIADFFLTYFSALYFDAVGCVTGMAFSWLKTTAISHERSTPMDLA